MFSLLSQEELSYVTSLTPSSLLRDHHVSRLPTHGLDLRTSAYTQVRLDEANPIPSEQIRLPLPFTETTIHPRYISHIGTGTLRYTTTLLRTSITLQDKPRDKCKLKLASSTKSGCSRQDSSVRHLALPVSPSLVVLLFWGSFQPSSLSSPYSSPYK